MWAPEQHSQLESGQMQCQLHRYGQEPHCLGQAAHSCSWTSACTQAAAHRSCVSVGVPLAEALPSPRPHSPHLDTEGPGESLCLTIPPTPTPQRGGNNNTHLMEQRGSEVILRTGPGT